jgi:transcription elongation factor SPT5
MILFKYRKIFEQLNGRVNEVGIILNIEKDSLTVLTQDGNIINMKPQAVRPRNEVKKALGSDRNGHIFGINDVVEIVDGPPIVYRKRATVMAVFRRCVFLRSLEIPENRGNYVTTLESVVLWGSDKGRKIISQGNNNMRGAPRMGNGGNRGRGGPAIRMNSRVKIVKGPLKGYIGIVKHATDSSARIELSATSRIVNVEIDKIKMDDKSERSGQYRQDNDRATGWGAATPMHGGAKTPMARDAKTPAWDASSKTPGVGASSVWGMGTTPFTERMDNNSGMASNQYSAL